MRLERDGQMKMVLDDAAGLNLVTAYEPGRVRIRGKVHSTSLLVFPRELETDWDATDVASLSSRVLRAITATASHDTRLTVAETELIRAVCATLNYPLPPILIKN